MKRNKFLSTLAILLTTLIAVIGVQTAVLSKTPSDLNIFSAIALTEALQEIKPLFERANPNVNVVYNFGASGQLRQQIDRGAPADVFIASDQKDMDALQNRNLILPETRRNLVKNQIVLIVPRTATGINNLQDLTKTDVQRIAIGNPDTVPIGRYTNEIFRNLNLTAQLQPKLVFGNTVRQVLTFVATGNVDAGLVWITDAKTSDRVRIVQTIPENLHSPALFPMTVLRESRNSDAGRAYVRFLTTPQARAVFRKYGFTPIP